MSGEINAVSPSASGSWLGSSSSLAFDERDGVTAGAHPCVVPVPCRAAANQSCCATSWGAILDHGGELAQERDVPELVVVHERVRGGVVVENAIGGTLGDLVIHVPLTSAVSLVSSP